jgi:hypothetical protein
MRAKEFITGTKQFIPTGVITNESIIEFIRKSAKTMDTKQRINIIEHMTENEGKSLIEVLDTRLASDIQQLLKSFTVEKAVIGKQYIPVSIDVYNDQIIIYDVFRNAPPKTKAKFGVLNSESNEGYLLKMGKNSFEYPKSASGNYVIMLTGLFDTVDNYDKFRMVMELKYDKELPPVDSNSVRESASGYIPSKKQANDPRYKTGLTKDVRPDTIQKNAKAFGFKTSRAGIPPLLRK